MCWNTHGTQLGHNWDTVRKQIANATGESPETIAMQLGTQLVHTVKTHFKFQTQLGHNSNFVVAVVMQLGAQLVHKVKTHFEVKRN